MTLISPATFTHPINLGVIIGAVVGALAFIGVITVLFRRWRMRCMQSRSLLEAKGVTFPYDLKAVRPQDQTIDAEISDTKPEAGKNPQTV